jgi:hypothetical protein
MNAKEILDAAFVRDEEIIISKRFDEVIDYGVTVSKNAAIIYVETDEAVIADEQAGIDS